MSEKKKLFPKLKKKISDFLTDESGEITKKDALGIAAGATILAGVESVDAASTYINTLTPSNIYPSQSEAYVPPRHPANVNSVSRTFVVVNDSTCSHVSWVVNWHISTIPQVNSSATKYTATTTHTSHGSHGSHWSRW